MENGNHKNHIKTGFRCQDRKLFYEVSKLFAKFNYNLSSGFGERNCCITAVLKQHYMLEKYHILYLELCFILQEL